jgi:hypothetical protein
VVGLWAARFYARQVFFGSFARRDKAGESHSAGTYLVVVCMILLFVGNKEVLSLSEVVMMFCSSVM